MSVGTVLKLPEASFGMGCAEIVDGEKMSQRIAAAIAARTSGRVYSLRVEAFETRVVVRGNTKSHYVKQLALAAVIEVLAKSSYQAKQLALDIVVE